MNALIILVSILTHNLIDATGMGSFGDKPGNALGGFESCGFTPQDVYLSFICCDG